MPEQYNDEAWLDPEEEITETRRGPSARLPRSNKGRKRLTTLEEPYTRTLLRWLADGKIFNGRARLFLWLVHRSFEGQVPVKVTNEAVEEIGLAPRRKAEYMRELEILGCIQITRKGHGASIVTVLPSLWLA